MSEQAETIGGNRYVASDSGIEGPDSIQSEFVCCKGVVRFGLNTAKPVQRYTRQCAVCGKRWNVKRTTFGATEDGRVDRLDWTLSGVKAGPGRGHLSTTAHTIGQPCKVVITVQDERLAAALVAALPLAFELGPGVFWVKYPDGYRVMLRGRYTSAQVEPFSKWARSYVVGWQLGKKMRGQEHGTGV